MWRLALVLTSIAVFQTFSSRTVGVRVDVLVTNGRTPVAGLTPADFELRDNGVLQSIDIVDSSGPINVVLALDVSSSTDGRRQADLQRASAALLAGLKAGDRAALVTFSEAVALRLPLTDDLAGIRASLSRVKPFGYTSVMDGIYVAITTIEAQPGRSLVVVCTDGFDTASWLTSDEVAAAAKRSNAVIYAVSAADVGTSAELKDVSDATGGQTMGVASSGELADAFQRILSDFRSRYVLAFTPRGVDPGGLHRLDVRVKRSGLSVKARQSYVGLSLPK